MQYLVVLGVLLLDQGMFGCIRSSVISPRDIQLYQEFLYQLTNIRLYQELCYQLTEYSVVSGALLLSDGILGCIRSPVISSRDIRLYQEFRYQPTSYLVVLGAPLLAHGIFGCIRSSVINPRARDITVGCIRSSVISPKDIHLCRSSVIGIQDFQLYLQLGYSLYQPMKYSVYFYSSVISRRNLRSSISCPRN